jgi:hypothetical protein
LKAHLGLGLIVKGLNQHFFGKTTLLLALGVATEKIAVYSACGSRHNQSATHSRRRRQNTNRCPTRWLLLKKEGTTATIN